MATMRWNTSVTTKLRVAYSELSPFVDVTETEGGDVLGGFMPHMLRKVGEWMNLEFIFIREPMDLYGGIWENNTWNGMIGMLFRNEVDLILNPLLPQEELFDFIHYTNPITIEAYTILSGKMSQDSGMFLYFNVLDISVWAGMAIAMLSIAATSAALFKSALLPDSFNWLHSTGWYCWNLFACMLKQVPKSTYLLRKNDHVSSTLLQILIMIWMFCIAFLVMNVFQSLLVSKMTLKKSKPVVDTLSDLASSKDCICLAPREMQIDEVIKDSPLEENRRAWGKINDHLPHTRVFQEDIMHEVEGGRFCIIHGHLILEDRLGHFYAKAGACNMHLSRNYFYPFSLLMAIHRKESALFFETFNTGITRLVDADITGHWFKSSLKVSNLCTSYSDNTLKPLGLQHIYGVLILWLAGATLATLVLLLEIISSKFRRQKLFPNFN